MRPGQPSKTAADYMVIGLSPALIMALVGSLCFFLIDVFYQGQMAGSARWVMFWFVLAVVLVARIGIEQTPQHAAVYGLALALAVWLYLVRTHPAYLLGIVLLGILWFCAHKLVWDCTLIDDEQDSSGQGLLQHTSKRERRGQPGTWVVWFSLAALPLFGLGQALLPPGGAARLRGFVFLVVYMAAALGLLVTTSFLGLRRYLRQRRLRMPPVVARAWLKFGVGVALLILTAAMFLPRPGANLVWTVARHQIDYRLRQASEYALRFNPPGKGRGAAGDQTGPSGDKESKSGQPSEPEKGSANNNNNQPAPAPPSGPASAPTPLPGASAYHLAQTAFLVIAVLVIGWVLFRVRYVLLQMARSAWAAIADLFRRWLSFGSGRKSAPLSGPSEALARKRSLADFRNPFFATGENAWPPAEIVLYTYDALQAWTTEQGIELHREQTPREFCQELSARLPELAGAFRQLALLYGHAAYSERLPANCDLDPLKQIWRRVAAN